MVYTFNNLSRAEVENILGLDVTFQETRFYKDVKSEGERSIVSILLDRKLGKLPAKTKKSLAMPPEGNRSFRPIKTRITRDRIVRF